MTDRTLRGPREPKMVAGLQMWTSLNLHFAHEESCVLAILANVQPIGRFGVMEIGEGDLVQRFREEPSMGGGANIGFVILEPEVIRYLDDNAVLEDTPLAKLTHGGQLSV